MEGQNLISALRPGPECPSIERLGRYVDGGLTLEERRREEPHIAACPNCQAELALLQAFATPAIRDDDAKVVRWGVEELRRREPEIFDDGSLKDLYVRRWLWIGRLRPALALAVVLLMLGGGYYLGNQGTPRLPADIGSSPDATRSLSVTVRGPIGDQASVPARLQWEPVNGAARYRVRLSEVDRQEIWVGRRRGHRDRSAVRRSCAHRAREDAGVAGDRLRCVERGDCRIRRAAVPAGGASALARSVGRGSLRSPR